MLILFLISYVYSSELNDKFVEKKVVINSQENSNLRIASFDKDKPRVRAKKDVVYDEDTIIIKKKKPQHYKILVNGQKLCLIKKDKSIKFCLPSDKNTETEWKFRQYGNSYMIESDYSSLNIFVPKKCLQKGTLDPLLKAGYYLTASACDKNNPAQFFSINLQEEDPAKTKPQPSLNEQSSDVSSSEEKTQAPPSDIKVHQAPNTPPENKVVSPVPPRPYEYLPSQPHDHSNPVSVLPTPDGGSIKVFNTQKGKKYEHCRIKSVGITGSC